MSDLKKLVCQCCGGSINRATLVCDYCGTRYEMKDDVPTIRIETFQNPVRDVHTKTIVPDYMERELLCGSFRDYVLKQAINNLAESIADCVHFDTEYDPRNMEYVVHSFLKVVVPKEKRTNLFPWSVG